MSNKIILVMTCLLGFSCAITSVAEQDREEYTSGEYTYFINDDDCITISKYSNLDAETIVIPDQIDGRQVTVIGNNAFSSVMAKEIVIPETVVEIQNEAFQADFSLEKVNIPASVQTMGRNPFRYNAIAEFDLSDNNTHFEILNEALYEIETGRLISFPRKSPTTRFICPDNTRIIGGFAFEHCESLKSIELNSGLEELEYGAFYDTEFPQIIVPDSVFAIGDLAFWACDAELVVLPECTCTLNSRMFSDWYLKYIDIQENDMYVSRDGVLFDKTRDALIRYPTKKEGDEYSVPEGTREIDEYAMGNVQLKSVYIPDTVEKIGKQAFLNCTQLESLKISESVTSIGEMAFDRCDAIVLEIVRGSYADTWVQGTEYNFKYTDGTKGSGDTISIEFQSSVANDVTGKWRLSFTDTEYPVTAWLRSYYENYFKSDDEIHAIINRRDNTTACLAVRGGMMNVTIHQYIPGEENDAKVLFGGDVISDNNYDLSTWNEIP